MREAKHRVGHRLLLSVAGMLAPLLIATACGEPTAPPMGSERQASLLFTSGGLVECPTNVTRSASAIVSPLGGQVAIDGTSISIPAGAVLSPTPITVTLPASKYMEVEITAGESEHFLFLVPATVTIDYSRCTRSDIDKQPLSVWYIDRLTKGLLEVLGGTDDKAARTVTFGTGHLSSYAIAY